MDIANICCLDNTSPLKTIAMRKRGPVMNLCNLLVEDVRKHSAWMICLLWRGQEKGSMGMGRFDFALCS